MPFLIPYVAYISLRFFSLVYAQVRKYILMIVSEQVKCDVLEGTIFSFFTKVIIVYMV